MHLRLDRFASPIGDILLATDDEGRLRALEFHDHEEQMHRLLRLHYGVVRLDAGPVPLAVTAPLAAYFAGDRHALAAVPVETGGTAFQRRVWAALRLIPPGTTTTYGRMAAALGAPGASRAVGLANGANPVSIVVPCHRVIGAGAALTGYGGGLHRKRWLLEHEGAAFRPERQEPRGQAPSRRHSRFAKV